MSDRKVKDLRDLAHDVPPPRDLWPAIHARIDPAGAGAHAADRSGTAGAARSRRTRRLAIGLAAAVALVAVGVWVGRSTLPGAPPDAGAELAGPIPVERRAGAPDTTVQPVAYVADPRYRQQRAELLAQVDARIAALPPASQAKVRESLVTIQKAVADLESALGREPSSALLQELLVNARQDEMRVLTTIAEAGAAGRET